MPMDLHINGITRKIENADIIRGYHPHPNVNFRSTAQKVVQMLTAVLRKNIIPVTIRVKIAIITQTEKQLTEEYSMSELMAAT